MEEVKAAENTSLLFHNDDGATIVAGRNLVTDWHRHVAIQLSIGMHGETIQVDGEEGCTEGSGFIVASNKPHRFHAAEQCTLTLLVDPAHPDAHSLAHMVEKDDVIAITLPQASEIAPVLIKALLHKEKINIKKIVGILNYKEVCNCKSDQRIRKAAIGLGDMTEEKVSSHAVAESVCLSDSRFLHLFRSEMGINFRRYYLWKKLQRAMSSLDSHITLTDISIQSGFSDSAHLSRTCREMCGLPPSTIRLCFARKNKGLQQKSITCPICE
jgi:AraC-like DNA-binding protein